MYTLRDLRRILLDNDYDLDEYLDVKAGAEKLPPIQKVLVVSLLIGDVVAGKNNSRSIRRMLPDLLTLMNGDQNATSTHR